MQGKEREMKRTDALLQPEPPRYFRAAYSNVTSHGKSHTLHQVRDGMAFCELGAAIAARGYVFGTTLHLYASDPRPLADLPAFRPSDLLVLTTRPPLNDLQPKKEGTVEAAPGVKRTRRKGTRKPLPRNGGDLERIFLTELGRYFAHCQRTIVTLSPHAAGLLKPGDAIYKDIGLYLYMRDDIQWYRLGPGVRETAEPPPTTVGFFIRLPSLPGVGCDMIVSFGMSGFTNLAWNRIVRVRYPEWFETRRFVMASVTHRGFGADFKPMTPEFADDERSVQVRILAEEPLRPRGQVQAAGARAG
jgi:hypothetical protein